MRESSTDAPPAAFIPARADGSAQELESRSPHKRREIIVEREDRSATLIDGYEQMSVVVVVKTIG